MRLLVFLLSLLILVACNEEKPKDDHQSAAEFRKKMQDREKKLADDLEKLAKQQNKKRGQQNKSRVDSDDDKQQDQPKDKQQTAKRHEKKQQADKQNVVEQKKRAPQKINLFEYLVLEAQARAKSSQLQREDALEKLRNKVHGGYTKFFGIVKDVNEKIVKNPENPQEKTSKYVVRFSSLYIGNKYFPYYIYFPIIPFEVETKDKSKVLSFGQNDYVSTLCRLEARKASINGKNYLKLHFVIDEIVKGLDVTSMGLKTTKSEVTASDILSYKQMLAYVEGLKSLNISACKFPLKNLGVEANFVGDFKREDLDERYRKAGNFRFIISKDTRVSFKEDEFLAELLLRMPKTQNVQITGKIASIKGDVTLENPKALFQPNGNKYQFSNGKLESVGGKLKTFDFHVYKDALLYKGKPISLSKFYLFLQAAKQVTSLTNLAMANKRRLNVFQAAIEELVQGANLPYQLGSISDKDTNVKTDPAWEQIQELYQVASTCKSYRKGYPQKLKDIAGRWSRNLRSDLFDDYVYINSSDSPFLDHDMQQQRAMIYPRKPLGKVAPVAFINNTKNAFGYSYSTSKMVLLEKKQLIEVEKMAKGLIKSIDIEGIKEELKTIAHACTLYQKTLGRQVRYPKNLGVLLEEQVLKNTPQSQELLQKYEYIYSSIYTFEDHEKKRQQVMIFPKNIDFPQIPVAFIDYSDDKISIVAKNKLSQIKKTALEARDRKK